MQNWQQGFYIWQGEVAFAHTKFPLHNKVTQPPWIGMGAIGWTGSQSKVKDQYH